MRKYEQTRQQRDEQALAQRERISQRKLDQQALALKAEQLSEAVVAGGFVLEDVINTLPEVADIREWEQAVTQIDGRTHVSMFAEREASARALRDGLPALQTQLSEAALEAGDLNCRSGTPQHEAAVPGLFVDRAS